MQLANTARTTLVTGIGTGDTLIELADSSRFPAVTATILTGTATSTAGNAYSVTGTGTSFLSQLSAGDVVTWTGIEHRRVIAVVSDTVVLIDRPASVSGVTLTKRNAYYLTLVNGGGLNREYVLVMSTSGANFTVARAQDDSTALTFSAGATVEYRVTSAFIVQVIERAVQLTIANLQETHGADMIGVDAAGIVAVTARTALEELAAAIAEHLTDSPAHAAADISFTPAAGIAATEVQAAIVELVNDAATALLGHVSDTTAHDATAIVFAPYGGISATDVQNAIEQMWAAFAAVTSDAEKTEDVITTAGYDFNAADDTQLAKAVSTYVAGADYWTCAGSGAAFTLTAPVQFPGIAETPTYVGTGNGFMTSVTGGSASVAETFTITCTVGGPTGTFTVTGSVTGAIASATVGTPYSTNKITFSLVDGSNDFIAGDEFTVEVGAAQSLRKPSQYFEGMCVRFIANAANTASATVDVGGLGSKSVTVPPFGDALPANAWVAGTPVELVYTGSGFVMVKQSKAIAVNDVKTSGTAATWTWPSGVTAVEVTAVGGGGGLELGLASTVNGEDSSVVYDSVTYTASGGSGSSGAGGTTSSGDINIPGMAGISSSGEGGRSYLGMPQVPGVRANGVGYGSGASGSGSEGAGGGGALFVKRIVRVSGLNTITYTVGAGGNSDYDGAAGVVIFKYTPWTDA